MAKIITFPRDAIVREVVGPPPIVGTRAVPQEQTAAPVGELGGRSRQHLRLAWDLFVLVLWVPLRVLWPIAKWLFLLEIVGQGVLALYRWSTPGMEAGWTFLIHYCVLIVLMTCFEHYRPRLLRSASAR